VTVSGPGGVGKTRLALAACARLEPAFADGARFVQLATVTDLALVPSTLALALKVKANDVEPAEAVVHALAEQELLVCLDNFEQLLDAALPPLTEAAAAQGG
jgi:predicted ATPase